MEDYERKLLIDQIKIQRKIERIKFDNKIINSVKDDLSNLYVLNPKFIAKHYSELWRIVTQAECSDQEKLKMMKFVNDNYVRIKNENREKFNNYSI